MTKPARLILVFCPQTSKFRDVPGFLRSQGFTVALASSFREFAAIPEPPTADAALIFWTPGCTGEATDCERIVEGANVPFVAVIDRPEPPPGRSHATLVLRGVTREDIAEAVRIVSEGPRPFPRPTQMADARGALRAMAESAWVAAPKPKQSPDNPAEPKQTPAAPSLSGGAAIPAHAYINAAAASPLETILGQLSEEVCDSAWGLLGVADKRRALIGVLVPFQRA